MSNDNEMALKLATIAANIGRETREQMESLDSRTKRNNESKAEVTAETLALTRESSGFGAPRFQGLARVASAYSTFVAQMNDPHGQTARDAAESATRSYVASMTNNTDKSAKGGKFAGFTTTIRLGDAGARIISALDRRVKYWESVIDQCKLEQSPESARMIAEANRFAKLASKCPSAESEPLTADGKAPTHNGRPSRTVNGIAIPYRGANPREGQLAELSRFYEAHGEAVLSDAFLDAFLDNGGKVEKAGATIQGEASRALQAIEFLQQNGGTRSTDAAFLQMAAVMLARIADSGFGESKAADALAFEAAAPSETPEDETGDDAPGVSFGAPVETPRKRGKRGGGL